MTIKYKVLSINKLIIIVMKSKIYNLLLLGSIILMGSCAKVTETAVVPDGGNGTYGSFKMVVDASIEESDSKGNVSNMAIYNFDNGEEISVINVTKGTYLGNLSCTQEGENPVTRMVNTEFSGTLEGVVDNGDKLAYIYPATEGTPGEAFESYSTDFSNQKADAKPRFSALCTKVSNFSTADPKEIVSEKVNFKLVTTYLNLNVYGLPANGDVTEMEITGISDGIGFSINDGEFVCSPVNDNTGSIKFGISTANSIGVAYVAAAIPVASRNNDGRTLKVTCNGKQYSTRFLKSEFNGQYILQALGVEIDDYLDVLVEHEVPGQNVTIKNTGTLSEYIRATVVANWVDEEGNIIKSETGSFNLGENWIPNGTFYNYFEKVEAGASTTALIDNFVATSEAPAGTKLEINVIAQGRETAW